MLSALLGAFAGASLVVAQSQIAWKPCGTNLQCGTFSAPLDYANPSAGQASIYMTRYLGTATNKKGSIFFNPGGPGDSGAGTVARFASDVVSIVGPEWDIIGFDPRGVQKSTPRIRCFRTKSEEDQFFDAYPQRFEAPSDLKNTTNLQRFLAQSAGINSHLEQLYKRCETLSKDNLTYVGSAAIVRDMIGMNTALHGPDANINYWGFSYGTLLGVYLTQMFPEKIGRVVLDGVVDPVAWSTSPPHKNWGENIHDVELTLSGFAKACVAAGNNCDLIKVLNGDRTTPEDILAFIDSLITTAYERGTDLSYYTSSFLRVDIMGYLYNPSDWANLAKYLVKAYNYFKDSTMNVHAADEPDIPTRFIRRDWTKKMASPSKRDVSSTLSDYSPHAVTCGDSINPATPAITTDDIFQELVQVTKTVSQRFGPMLTYAGLYCHKWAARAVERYTGPFNKQTKNPILVVGSEADPVTPFSNARKVDALLGNSSRLILQHGYGHTTRAMTSKCSRKAIGDYFNNGILPSADGSTVCGTDMELFPVHRGGNPKNHLPAQGVHDDNLVSLDSLQRHFKALFIVSVSQALVMLVVALVVMYAKMRRTKNDVHAQYIPTAANDWKALNHEQSSYGADSIKPLQP